MRLSFILLNGICAHTVFVAAAAKAAAMWDKVERR